MRTLFSHNWFLFAGGWMFLNGILHDIFVIRAHKGPYDRELLRLLMDGHLLVLSGLLLAVGWLLLRSGNYLGAVTGLIVSASMVVYCAMIFPFLRSYATLFISVAVFIVSCWHLLTPKTP